MHVKTLIMDGKVVLTGSVNMTHNGYENNKEHMYRIADPAAVAEVLADFERTWDEAEEVTRTAMDKVLENSARRKRNKDDRRPSRSPSKDHAGSTSRSLSADFEDAAPSQALASNGESSGAVVSEVA